MYGTHHSSISSDFMTFGNEGIGVGHAIQTRLSRAEQASIMSNLRDVERATGLRNWLGSTMISLGTLIAGKTAHMQERQATRPSSSPKSGFVPTP